MTTQLKKWKIYCSTDSKYEYIWQTSSPTTCPINGGHSVDTNRVSSEGDVLCKTITNTDSPYDYGHQAILCDTTSGSITVNLPPASVSNNGTVFIKKTSASNTVTIDGDGSDQIDSLATKSLTSLNEIAILLCDGTEWTSQSQRALVSDVNNMTYLPLSKTDVGLANVENLKTNLVATSAPTSTDDTNSGYSVGSRWIDTSNDTEYVCLDSTVSSAVWTETTQTGTVLPTTTKGDLVVNNGSTDTRLAVGTNGQILSADSTQTEGIKWIDQPVPTDTPIVQARAAATTVTYTKTTWTDINLPNTDVESDTTIVEHGTSPTDRITVKQTGYYSVSYVIPVDFGNGATSADINAEARVRVNDTTVAEGSQTCAGNHYSGSGFFAEKINLTCVFDIYLTANDYLTLQARYTNDTVSTINNPTSIVMTVVSRQSIKGDTGNIGPQGSIGPQGPVGPQGLIGLQGDPGPTGSGSTILVKDEGTLVSGTPHSILNFTGDGIEATNAGAGQVNISVTATSPNTTKGDITVHNGTNDIRLPVGIDGYYLVADSGETGGIKWDSLNLDTTSYGFYYMSGNTTETIVSVAGTLYKAVGTTTAGLLDDFTHTNNRLTYTGTDTKQFLLTAAATVITITNDDISGIVFFKNGSQIGAFTRGNAHASKFENASDTKLVELATNDYVEIYTTDVTDNTNVIIQDLNVSVINVGGKGGKGDKGITWQGSWTTATSYIVDDTVTENGSSYICTTAHTSTANDEPGVGGSWTTYWDLLAQKGDNGSGSTVIIKDEGTTVTGGPHDTINFIGEGVSVTDGGSGVADVLINGGYNQVVETTIGTGSTTAELDMSVAPTISTGTQIATLNITPSSTSNRVLLNWHIIGDVSADRAPYIFVFRGSTLIGIDFISGFKRGYYGICNGSILDNPSTTSQITYSIRIAISPSGTVYWGQNVNNDTLGGTVASKQFFYATELSV